jgi:hypothetical protein
MMSQNRQADKDRLMAQHDYQINLKAEQEVKAIMHHLEQQDDIMIDILRHLGAQHQALLERGAIAPATERYQGATKICMTVTTAESWRRVICLEDLVIRLAGIVALADLYRLLRHLGYRPCCPGLRSTD